MRTTIDGRGCVSTPDNDAFIVKVPSFFNAGVSMTSSSVSSSSVVASAVTLVDASGGNMTVTLPDAASCSGQSFTVKKIDATGYSVTISATNGQNIDGSSSLIVTTQWVSVTMVASGTSWYIV